jgi:hypothetical protein
VSAAPRDACCCPPLSNAQNFCLDANNSNSCISLIDYGFARHSYGEGGHVRANGPPSGAVSKATLVLLPALSCRLTELLSPMPCLLRSGYYRLQHDTNKPVASFWGTPD